MPASDDPSASASDTLCRPDAERGARRAGRRRPARRRPPAAAQLVREPRVPGVSGGRLASWWRSSIDPGAGATRRSSKSTLRAGTRRDGDAGGRRRWTLAGCSDAAACATSAHRRRWPRCTPRRASLRGLRRAVPGARPSSTIRRCCEWLGRFVGRLHAVGAAGRSRTAQHARRRDVRRRAARLPARARTSSRPTQLPGWRDAADAALDAGRRRLRSARPRAHAAAARRLPSRQHAVARRRARTSSTSTTRARARRCRTCGCCCRAIAASMRAQLAHAARGLRGVHGLRRARARADRAAAHVAHDPPQRLDGRALGDPAFPAAFPWFGSAAYWSQQTTQLREQIDAMARGRRCRREPPARPAALRAGGRQPTAAR